MRKKGDGEKPTFSRFRQYTKNVLHDAKQYISFFAAILIIQTLFFTLIGAELTQNNYTHERLNEVYDYHMMMTGVSEEQKYKLELTLAAQEPNGKYPHIVSISPDGDKYTVKLRVDRDNYWLQSANAEYLMKGYENKVTVKYSPLYDSDPELNWIYEKVLNIVFWVLAVITAIFGFWYYKLCNPTAPVPDGEYHYKSTVSRQFGTVLKKSVGWVLLVFSAITLIVFLVNICYGANSAFVWTYLLLLAVCIGFLMLLYNVRVNHYKYQYGIYMTFGASFSRLYMTAVVEMLIISLITLVPSILASAGCMQLIYADSPASPVFDGGAIINTVVLNVFIIMFSVYLPMKIMSRKTPIALLSAQDNSNYVTSPRRSFKILNKSFPFHYELFGMWRFRKYFVRLVVIAVSFGAVFLCGFYIAEMNKNVSEWDDYEFVIERTSNPDEETVAPDDGSTEKSEFVPTEETIGDYTIGLLSEVKGVKFVYWNTETAASSVYAHMLLKDENVKSGGYSDVIKGQGDTRAAYMADGYENTMNSFKFTAYNETLISAIEQNNLFTVRGDMRSVLNDPDRIIISENIHSDKKFSFKVGDKVVLATKDAIILPTALEGKVSDKMSFLKTLISQSMFFYKEYTVGAVVNYSGEDERLIFGVNEDVYNGITKTTSIKNNIKIYTDDGLTSTDFERIGGELERLLSDAGCTVNETYSAVYKNISDASEHYDVIMFVSIMVMLLSPLIWFFSQLQFYRKRSKENYILGALGAKRGLVKRLNLIDGAVLAVLSFVFTLIISFIADWLVYLFCLYFLRVPTSAGGGISYWFYMPPAALAACLLTAVICGFVSSLLPSVLSKAMRSKADIYNSADDT